MASKASAEVRARATYLRALVYDRQGNRDEAAKLRAQLGLIDRFQVAGPFDNEGKSGYDTVFDPENTRYDVNGIFAGKDRKVGWRQVPKVVTQGIVNLEAFLRPEANVTAYLTVAVKAPKAMKAALRIGSTGAVKA